MTDIEVDAEDEVVDDNGRADLVEGLRALATFLEETPEIPFQKYHDHSVNILFNANDEQIADVVKVGGTWEKNYDTNYLNLVRRFGNQLSIEVYCNRRDICEPRTVKTETVTEPDPEWLQAEIRKLREQQPTRTIEKTTVLEWDCKPLLGVKETVDGS